MSKKRLRRNTPYQQKRQLPETIPLPVSEEDRQAAVLKEKIIGLTGHIFANNVVLGSSDEDYSKCLDKSADAATVFAREMYGVQIARAPSRAKSVEEYQERQAAAPQPLQD